MEKKKASKISRLTSILSTPFVIGNSINTTTGQMSTDGKISTAVLVSCIVPFIFVVIAVLANQPSYRRPSTISWGLVEITFAVGSFFTIFLSLSAYKNRTSWLMRLRTEVVSQKPRFVFLWLFGFCMIINSALNMAINIDCMVKGEQGPFPGEKILSTISHFIAMMFFASQLGFIAYFRNYEFYSSVILNYGMCMMLITHLVVWFFSVLYSFYRNTIFHSTNFTVVNATDCYWRSDINKLRHSLEPYLHPVQTEFSLLATAFLLRIWFSNDQSSDNVTDRKLLDVNDEQFDEKSSLLHSGNQISNYGIQQAGETASTSRPANFQRTVMNIPNYTVEISSEENNSVVTSNDFTKCEDDLNFSKTKMQNSMSFYVILLIGIALTTPLVIGTLILMSVLKDKLHMYYVLECIRTTFACFHFLFLILAFIALNKQCRFESKVQSQSGKGQILLLSSAGAIAHLTFSFLSCILIQNHERYSKSTTNVIAFEKMVGICGIYIQTVLIMYSARCVRKSTELSTKLFGVENIFLLLLITNGVAWFCNTFLYSKLRKSSVESEFYSPEYWAVINEVIFPFVIFYRFHSFVDMYERYRLYQCTNENDTSRNHSKTQKLNTLEE